MPYTFSSKWVNTTNKLDRMVGRFALTFQVTINSPPLNSVINSFISASARSMATKLVRMVDHHVHHEDGVSISRPNDKHSYLHFHNLCNNKAYKDGEPPCSNLTLQVTMVSPPLGLMTNIHAVNSNSISLVTNKPARIVKQVALESTSG